MYWEDQQNLSQADWILGPITRASFLNFIFKRDSETYGQDNESIIPPNNTNAMPFSLVMRYEEFGGTCCASVQG
jgi:hypothetical protein